MHRWANSPSSTTGVSAPPSCLFQTIFRAKFSSITESAIVQAMNSLVEPNENEARSVDARMELDLRIGCSFTRFQTKEFQVCTCACDREALWVRRYN